MLKEYWDSLSNPQKETFLEISQISPAVMKSKYLRLHSKDRANPRPAAFESLLRAINATSSKSGMTLSRADLAVYFYAAPDQTGQEKAEAA